MRFRKSIKIAPGIKLNFSKSGISSTVGGKGLSVNVGQNGAFLNTGIPGTGISNRTKLDEGKPRATRKASNINFENEVLEAKTEEVEMPHDIPRAKKYRKRFMVVAIAFGVLGIFSIPTIVWAVIYFLISGVLLLLWNSANKMIKESETAQAENRSTEEVIEKESEVAHEELPEKIVPSAEKKYKNPDNGFDKENWKKINEALLRKKEIEAQANAVAIEASDQYQEEKKPDYSDASAYIIYDANMADKFKRFYEENAIFHIKYQKYGGEISERDIELKSVEIGVFDEPSYIRAFCFLREAERDFRLDRIITLSVNGEDVENPELFFVRLHYNSPEYKIKMAFTEHQNEIMLLIFFARADGIMRKNERGIITRYFNEFVDGIPSNYTDSYLKQLQCELSLTTIVRRAKSMNATTKARLLDTVSQIYALKKSPSKIEEGVFEKLKKALSG